MSDQQFEQQFENCTLPPALLTSEAHLRLAYIHVKKYGFKTAVINLCKQLSAYNVKFGAILVLSKSIIKAFVKLICDFIKKALTTSFRELMLKFPELKIQFSALLTQPKQTEITNDTEQMQCNLIGFSVL